jgi:hypothetical protein
MMFGRFKNAKEASEPVYNGGFIASDVIEKPRPIAVTLDPLPDLSEYQKVADTPGFEPPEIEAQKREVARREVVEFLLDKGYPIYSNKAVHDFMAKLAEKEKKVFCWARLRGKATPAESERMREFMQNFYVDHSVSREEHGLIVPSPYRKRVPLEMLKRAAAIKEKFGKEVEFYVSDYAVVDPDPFIMVKRGNCEHIVFGVWDEPGWGNPAA